MKRRTSFVVAVIFSAGCIDPAMPRELPPNIGFDSSLVVFMALDPALSDDSTDAGQSLSVSTAVVPDTTLEGLQAVLSNIDGSAVQGQRTTRDCVYTADFASTLECFRFPGALVAGQQYQIEVSADGYPTAVGQAVVLGDFEIIDHVATGTPPGAVELHVSWTASSSAYRYMVAISTDSLPRCYSSPCKTGWVAVTASTSFSGTIPAGAVSEGEGPWTLGVYAVDKPLYDYLVSGTPGDLFSVPPVGNVQGGYGVMGAWVRRPVPLH